MHLENLVSMANQIGAFFSAYPDRQEALEGIATHIHKFWEPRMRLRLIEALIAKKRWKALPPIFTNFGNHVCACA